MSHPHNSAAVGGANTDGARTDRGPTRRVRDHPGLLLKCLALVVVIRATLTLRSYGPVLEAIRNVDAGASNRRHPMLFVWAVRRAARFVPGATCLTQALAVRWLMARSEQPSRIRIGVVEEPGKGFAAHAWVLHQDVVIIGGDTEDIRRYTPIVDL